MRTIAIENLNRIKKAVPKIENSIKIQIGIPTKGNRISIKGNELNEYLTEQIIQAIDFGFDAEEALLLKNEDFILEFIDMKNHTNRKNMKDVRARIIGTEGKARKTIEKLTGAEIVIKENTIGIIADSEHIDAVLQGTENLIRGAKHGNVFSYLEKQNINKRKMDSEDLGLKRGIENLKEEYEEQEENLEKEEE